MRNGRNAFERERGLAAEVVEHRLEQHQDLGRIGRREVLELVSQAPKMGDRVGAASSRPPGSRLAWRRYGFGL